MKTSTFFLNYSAHVEPVAHLLPTPSREKPHLGGPFESTKGGSGYLSIQVDPITTIKLMKISDQATVEHAWEMFVKHKLFAFPIVDDHSLVAALSISDSSQMKQ